MTKGAKHSRLRGHVVDTLVETDGRDGRSRRTVETDGRYGRYSLVLRTTVDTDGRYVGRDVVRA